MKSWLLHKPKDISAEGRLSQIKSAYIEQLKKTAKKIWLTNSAPTYDEIVKKYEISKDLLFPANYMDSLKELIDRINLIDQVKKYIERLQYEPNVECTIKFPDKHIDIPPEFLLSKWNANIKAQMEQELTALPKYIADAQEALQKQKQKIEQNIFVIPSDLSDYIYYQEKIKLLNLEKNKLMTQLSKHEHATDVQDEKPAKNKPAKFTIFKEILSGIRSKLNISKPLDIILRCYKLYSPYFDFEAEGENRKINVTLDLHKKSDRNLFLLAALLYCRYRKYKVSEYKELLDLFQRMQSELILGLSTKNFDTAFIGSVLKQTGLELNASIWKIEKLLNYFSQFEFPHLKKNIHIDELLQIPKIQNVYYIKKEASSTTQIQQNLVAVNRKPQPLLVMNKASCTHVIDDVTGRTNKMSVSILNKLSLVTTWFTKPETKQISSSVKKRNMLLDKIDDYKFFNNDLNKRIKDTLKSLWHDTNEKATYSEFQKSLLLIEGSLKVLSSLLKNIDKKTKLETRNLFIKIKAHLVTTWCEYLENNDLESFGDYVTKTVPYVINNPFPASKESSNTKKISKKF